MKHWPDSTDLRTRPARRSSGKRHGQTRLGRYRSFSKTVDLHHHGTLDEARKHLEKALEIDEAVYGKAHLKVAIRANNIAAILQGQGDLDGAREQIARALAILERVYGLDHPRTVIARKNLAAIGK